MAYRLIVVFVQLLVIVLIDGQSHIEINKTGCVNMTINIQSSVLTTVSILNESNIFLCTLIIREEVLVASVFNENYKNRINCTVSNNKSSVCFLDGVTDTDAGVYKTNAAGGTGTSTLYVMKKPTTATITASGDAVESMVLNLTCSSSSTSLPSGFLFTYTWTVDNISISDPRYLVTGPGKASFNINTLQKADHGKQVRCTGTEENGISSSESSAYIIDVKYPPIIAALTNRQPVEGSVFSVLCDVTPGNPTDNTVYWTWSGDPAFKQSGTTLYFPNIQTANNGTYTCTAENTYPSGNKGKASKSLSVNVIYAPVITTLQFVEGSEEVKEQSLVRFKCEVGGGPVSTISWKKVENNTVIHTDHNTTVSYLTIHSANCVDTGLYLVTAENEYGLKSENLTFLSVQCSPRLSEKQSLNVNVVPGENLIINLEILSNPTPSFTDIKWNLHSINGNGTRTITDGTDGFNTASNLATIKQRAVLIKSQIATSDYGNYTLLVQNDIGQLKQDFEVRSSQRTLCDDTKTANNLGTITFGTLFGIICAVSVLLVAYIFHKTRRIKHSKDKTQERTGRDVYDELHEAKKDENKYEAISKDEDGKETSGRYMVESSFYWWRREPGYNEPGKRLPTFRNAVYVELEESAKDENKYEDTSRPLVDPGRNERTDVNPESAQGDEERVQMYDYPDTEQLKLKKIKSTITDTTTTDSEYTDVSSHQ